MTALPTLARRAATAAFAAAAIVAPAAHATATEELRTFVKTVKTGRATFTQTVTAPDGRKKITKGRFEFARPSRFRFVYEKPYAQTVVGDGTKVWIYDPDLNQVSARKMGTALAATPAALLVSTDIDQAFALADQPDRDGLEWVEATPKQADGTVRWLKAGFKGHTLAQIQIADSFGQVSAIVLDTYQPNAALPPETFQFTPPAGADVVDQ